MSNSDKKLCLNGCFQIKPTTAFGKHPRTPDGLASQCKACELERIQRHRHGMSGAEKAAIAAEQGGCAVCKRTEPGKKGWMVDHDHACCPGERSCAACRRGILCAWCNAALGYAMDNPATLRTLADYLESGERIDQADVERVGMELRLTESLNRRAEAARTKRRSDNGLTESPSHLPEITPSSVTHTRTYGGFISTQEKP